MAGEVWIWMENHQDRIEDTVYGLLQEAEAWSSGTENMGDIVIIALGSGIKSAIEEMGLGRADRVIVCDDLLLENYNGERYTKQLLNLLLDRGPSAFFMADSDQTRDLAPRLAAEMNSVLITRAVDLKRDPEKGVLAVRPVAGCHLFEELCFSGDDPFIMTFLTSVLGETEPDVDSKPEMVDLKIDSGTDEERTQLLEVIQAAPDEMALEDAALIVAAGRGVGKEEGVAVVRELAEIIGASIGATRPVVDWGAVEFERQIGQTGKTVTPDLIINCGISGANEYTAGMEKSQHVIAINIDARSRIFRFSDLGAVADVKELLPLLIEKIGRIENEGNKS